MQEFCKKLFSHHDEHGSSFVNIVVTVAVVGLLTFGGIYGYNTFFSEASDEETQDHVTTQLDDAQDAADVKERDPLAGFDRENELP